MSRPGRYTSEEYLDLPRRGLIAPDDRVELLEGVIVAMSPQSPRHASTVTRVRNALLRALGDRAEVREEKPLVASGLSVPEPDVAVVAGSTEDYAAAHPTGALLVVEVADSSLPQDRLTKAAIYAAAGIADYWVVNLRQDVVHVLRDPDREGARYREERAVSAGERLGLLAFPDVSIPVADLLPAPRPA